MNSKKEKKDPETKKPEESTQKILKAEGVLESVGVQSHTLYLVVDGRRVNVAPGERIRLEVLK